MRQHTGLLYWGIRAILLLLIVAVSFVHFFLPGLVERSMNVVAPVDAATVRPDAQALHDSLFIADLHSDSMLWKRNFLKRSNTGHMDLPRLQEGNVALQVFSATTKSPRGLNYDRNLASSSDDVTRLAVLSFWPPRTWDSLFERARYQLEKLERYAKNSNGELMVIRTRGELSAFIEKRKQDPRLTAGLFLIEGAHPLEGDIDSLDRLFDEGLRVAGLTHFFDNELGGSLHGISGEGLTPFGIRVIQRAEKLGMIVDIAHSSPAMVEDVLANFNGPLMLSHGGMKGHCDRNRNLDDKLMRRFAQKGGLLGVGYWDGAICNRSPAGVAQAIRYAVDALGIEHVALGSDYDGTVVTGFDTSQLVLLTQALMDAQFTESEIRAVMGENVKRFFLTHLPE
ncbi:MAG: membrane dipeptidase [Pseudomonadota bacterium]